MKKTVDKCFLIIFMLIIIGGFLKSLIFRKDINNYENRVAYNFVMPTIKNFVDKSFQDSIELALSDQIPLAITMKKNYNNITTKTKKYLADMIFQKECQNRYINIGNDLIQFGCDNYLVSGPWNVYDIQKIVDTRITNINKLIETNDTDVYIYYIERDRDIDFSTNKKSGFAPYLKENIKTKKFGSFQINNFNEFAESYYKTDHHWNYKGSYKAYLDLVELLNLDNPIKVKDTSCSKLTFTGSHANVGGASNIYNEKFCVYNFDIPTHKTIINKNEVAAYGNYNLEALTEISYANYYGGDAAELILDFKEPKKENILIFGESYDNAILNLLASHFNKTYSIDLRHYEREFGKPFDYNQYIKEHDIDKVLIIGSMSMFTEKEFNMEV